MDPEPEPPSTRDEFEVAIVYALYFELDVIVPLLDQVWDQTKHPSLSKVPGDFDTYSEHGRIGQHNVVLVLLPQRMGKASAAHVSSDLQHSYRNLRLVLLVGICGGVPFAGDTEIMLGDVVISSSLVQYDLGDSIRMVFVTNKAARTAWPCPTKNSKTCSQFWGPTMHRKFCTRLLRCS